MCQGDCQEDKNGSNHGLKVGRQVEILSGIYNLQDNNVSTFHFPDVHTESMRLLVAFLPSAYPCPTMEGLVLCRPVSPGFSSALKSSLVKIEA